MNPLYPKKEDWGDWRFSDFNYDKSWEKDIYYSRDVHTTGETRGPEVKAV